MLCPLTPKFKGVCRNSRNSSGDHVKCGPYMANGRVWKAAWVGALRDAGYRCAARPGDRIQSRHPPDPLRPVLRLPRSRCRQAQDQAALRHRSRRAHRTRARAASPSCRAIRSGANSSAASLPPTPPSACRPPMPDATLKPAEIDLIRRWIAQGARWQPFWSLHPAAAARPAAGPRCGLGAQSDRPLHPRAARTRRTASLARGRSSATLHPPRDARPHRPSAHARPRSTPSCRRLAGRLREGGGPPARVAALRRAHGLPLAGSGALRRHQRLPDRRRRATCGAGAIG